MKFKRNYRVERILPADVVYFDLVGLEYFKNSALKDLSFIEVPCRGEYYLLNWNIFWNAISLFPWVASKRKSLYISWRGAITVAYFVAVLKTIRCRVVLTFTDNSRLYQNLMELLPEIHFIAVQNGMRWFYHYRDMGPKINFQHLLTFGLFEKQLLESMGGTAQNCIPAGSLRLGALDHHRLKSMPVIYDICFVSQLRKGLLQGKGEPNHLTSMTNLVQFLARFSQSRQLKLCVAMASREPWEREFFELQFKNSKFQADVTFCENNEGGKSSYELACQSQVTFGYFSALLVEVFGLGRKVFFCNLGPNPAYDFPMDFDFALRRPGYELFEERLESLLSMNTDLFRSKYQSFYKYFLAQNEMNPPSNVARDLILNLLHTDATL
jgi:surface carbohydrate biosynthesis protein